MTMTKRTEKLPRPAAELERLAEYYDTHDTSVEMEHGDGVALGVGVQSSEEVTRVASCLPWAKPARAAGYRILQQAGTHRWPPGAPKHLTGSGSGTAGTAQARQCPGGAERASEPVPRASDRSRLDEAPHCLDDPPRGHLVDRVPSGHPPIGRSAQHEVKDQVGVDVRSQSTGVDSATEGGEKGGAPWNQVVLAEPVSELCPVGCGRAGQGEDRPAHGRA